MSEPMLDPTAPRGRGLSAAVMFAANLILALLWVAMSGHFEVLNLLLGFAFGYLVMLLLQRVVGSSSYFHKSAVLSRFIGFFLLEVVRSNIRVAVDVATPVSHAQPGIVAVPLDARTDAEITLLASLITMTPGSLALDVADDRSVIYVHSMFVDDPEALRRSIKHDLERRVLELLR